MNIIEGIKTRRSIRKFKADAVAADVLKNIIDTAAYAPSWKNSQTTRYTAIVDTVLKGELAMSATLGFEHNRGIINNAPCLIVLSTVNGRSGYERDGSPTTSKGSHWQSFDAGIAAEAFCLAAHAEGLSTVIMGIFDEDKVAKLISLPEGRSVSALIAIGYADETPEPPKRKTSQELLTIK